MEYITAKEASEKMGCYRKNGSSLLQSGTYPKCLLRVRHQDCINAKEVVSGLDDVIDFNVFTGSEDPIFLIQHLDMIAGQTIACHASAAVDHVDLKILVEATILFAVTLLDNLLEKQWSWFNFLGLSRWLFGVCRYVPDQCYKASNSSLHQSAAGTVSQ